MRFILLIILSGCTSLFYQPTRILYATPGQLNIKHEDIFFDASDGKRLHGWYLHHQGPKKAKGLVTFFHGNAQNLSAHFYVLAWLTQHDYDIFIFDYRGYGLSVGEPSPKEVNLDALAALNKSLELLEKNKINHWVVHAQSLGGMVAMRSMEDFKQTDKIDLLILDSTFDSYDDIAFDKLSDYWFTFIFSPLGPLLVSDSMAPTTFFENYKGRVLVTHGDKDEIIPMKFGQRIFDRLQTKNKSWWPIAGAAHIQGVSSDAGMDNFKKYLEFVNQ